MSKGLPLGEHFEPSASERSKPDCLIPKAVASVCCRDSLIRHHTTMPQAEQTNERCAADRARRAACKQRRGPRPEMERLLLAVNGSGRFRPTAINAVTLEQSGKGM